jgi:hypothetical protein
MKTTWLVRTLGTLGFGAIAVRLARKRLLDACNHERAEVLKRDYGYLRPDPGKLIR